MKDVTLSVRIDAEVARLFRKLAEQRGVSVSDLLRDAIKDSLFDYGDVRPAPGWPTLESRSVTAAIAPGNVIWLTPPTRVA